jgi:hypothetical protein
MARLSLDDDVERPAVVESSKLSRRSSIGGIRQSALKFSNDLQQESTTSTSLNKDITTAMQGLESEQGDVETQAKSQAEMTTSIQNRKLHEDPPTSTVNLETKPTISQTTSASRIPVLRSTVNNELQVTSSGLCFAVRSRHTSNRKPLRSNSASAVMTMPSINPNIKSNFYFASPQDDPTPKPPVATSLKRKRRSSIGPRLSLPGFERPRIPFVEKDIIIPLAKQPKIERKTIVLTSMDKQTRRACVDAVEKLGIYTIGNEYVSYPMFGRVSSFHGALEI